MAYKKIDKYNFKYHSTHRTKHAADVEAKKIRKTGKKARVIRHFGKRTCDVYVL